MGPLVLTSERDPLPSRRSNGPAVFSVPLREIVAIEGYTRRVSGTVRVTTSDGSMTVDQIRGTKGRCSPMTPRRRSAAKARPDPTRWRSGRTPRTA